MRTLSAAVAAVLLLGRGVGLAAEPVSVAAPDLKVGDGWGLAETVQKGTSSFTRHRQDVSVERLNADTMVVAVKQDGSPNAPQNRIVGLDWGLRLALDGEQKATARPLSFPMKIGESWN